MADSSGRFCVLAIEGRTTPSIEVSGQTHASQLVVRSSAPVDPRLAAPELRESLRRRGSAYAGPDRMPFLVFEPQNPNARPLLSPIRPSGAHDATMLWNPKTDRTDSCQELDVSPPWYRFEDSARSPQFAALSITSLIALGLFAFGLVRAVRKRLRLHERATLANRSFQAAAAAAVLDAILFVVLWSVL